MGGVWRAGLGLTVAFASLAGAARAQTIGTTTASFNIGYGRVPGQENRPVESSLRDASGNLAVVNGVIGGGGVGSASGAAGAGASVSSSVSSSGSASASARGGGFGTATALGNNLNVIVNGDHNTVVVTSTQTNTGAITAITNVSGPASGN